MRINQRRSKKPRRRGTRQLGLRLLRGRGGPGRGQGRKKRKHGYVPHRRRGYLDRNFAVHVSTSVVAGLPSLRGRKLWKAVRRGFVHGCVFGPRVGGPREEEDGRVSLEHSKRAAFRIVEFSVQGQHIHLICEARDRRWLSRGIQGFKVRVAKAINRALGGRKGQVFRDRYHERIVQTPTQMRHTLAYVLSNQRHHAYEASSSYPAGTIDPYSSAHLFGGWARRKPRPWAQAPPTDSDDLAPVAHPTTWLLRTGWRRAGGPISPSTIPGLPRSAPPLPVW